jgi:hypothetical protein
MRKKEKKSVVTGFALIVILAIIAVIAAFCYVNKYAAPLSERERFIEANTQITCEILKDPSLSVDLQRSKELSQEIFTEYNFPIEDNEEMLSILDKYENDEELILLIQEKLETECVVQE